MARDGAVRLWGAAAGVAGVAAAAAAAAVAAAAAAAAAAPRCFESSCVSSK